MHHFTVDFSPTLALHVAAVPAEVNHSFFGFSNGTQWSAVTSGCAHAAAHVCNPDAKTLIL
jgi:hypothetical protein